jgi:hypothetical protein
MINKSQLSKIGNILQEVLLQKFEELMKNPGAGFAIPNIEVPSE